LLVFQYEEKRGGKEGEERRKVKEDVRAVGDDDNIISPT
jgi:hypothetical protein